MKLIQRVGFIPCRKRSHIPPLGKENLPKYLWEGIHPGRLTWNLQITQFRKENDLPNLHDYVPC